MWFTLHSSAPLKLKFPICLNAMTRWLLIRVAGGQRFDVLSCHELSLLVLTSMTHMVTDTGMKTFLRAHILKLDLKLSHSRDTASWSSLVLFFLLLSQRYLYSLGSTRNAPLVIAIWKRDRRLWDDISRPTAANSLYRCMKLDGTGCKYSWEKQKFENMHVVTGMENGRMDSKQGSSSQQSLI